MSGQTRPVYLDVCASCRPFDDQSQIRIHLETDAVQEEDMVHRALDALMDALGPVEMTRFITLPRRRLLDSVRRHRQWAGQSGQGLVFRPGLRCG